MSLQFKAYALGPLETNCYLIWDSETSEAAVIDPGGPGYDVDVPESLNIRYVLLTHGHPDHCFYAGAAARDHLAEIAMHSDDIEQIEQSRELAEMFYDMSKFVRFSPAVLLSDGDVLQLGRCAIEVLHTPGHSRGGLCFVTEVGVFCGDTVFAGSIGRTDFAGGSFEDLMSSIREKILTMRDDTPLYPGHGPATTVGKERATNPYLT